MRQAYLTCLLGSAVAVAATIGATAPTWSQQARPEMCRTVIDGNGEPVVASSGDRVLTMASEPCPQPVVAAAPPPPPEPAPAAGPIFTIDGDVAFAFDSDAIKPEFYPELDQIAAELRENPAKQLALVGHTDSIGTAEYNQDLSERRAASVARHLEQAGVPAERLVTSGRGLNEPVASNETPEGRAQNRRVEIRTL